MTITISLAAAFSAVLLLGVPASAQGSSAAQPVGATPTAGQAPASGVPAAPGTIPDELPPAMPSMEGQQGAVISRTAVSAPLHKKRGKDTAVLAVPDVARKPATTVTSGTPTLSAPDGKVKAVPAKSATTKPTGGMAAPQLLKTAALAKPAGGAKPRPDTKIAGKSAGKPTRPGGARKGRR